MDVTRYSYHTAEILKDVRDKVKAATGVDTFVADRPVNNKKERKEMIVVSLPYGIRQKGAYQTSYLRVEIIVKDKTEGVVNVARLDELSNKLQALFPMSIANGRCKAKVPTLVLTGRDTIGYSIWNLQGGMIISKLDTYNKQNTNT